MAEIVKRLHAVYIYTDAALTQKVPQLRIASAAFVTGNIKRNNTHLAEALQRFKDRRPLLFGHFGQRFSVNHYISTP